MKLVSYKMCVCQPVLLSESHDLIFRIVLFGCGYMRVLSFIDNLW